MPRVSKIKSGASHSSTTAYKEDERKEYYCCKCGKSYKNQRGNFPASQSLIFHGNNGYLPICVHCLDELYEHYKEVLKNEADAMRRICLKFDIYWNTEIFAMTERMNPNMSRVRSYISKSNLVKFCGKTFD